MSATPSDSSASAHSISEPVRPRRRWVWWLLGVAALLLAIVLVAQHLLDPWLRRKLEQQVATQTHGQYRLQVGALHTSLWQRAIRLSGLRLRPAATVADTLPRVRLDVAQLNVTGIGLLALLRKGVVPVDSLVLDSARIEVLALAQKPTRSAGQPLHERLPLKLKGLEIGYFGLLHTQANYQPGGAAAQPTAQFRRADLSAQNLLISAAGAADSQRLGYAIGWNLQLQHAQGQAAGHKLAVAGLSVSTADQRIQLDSGRVRPLGPARAGQPRVDLTLPRLRLTGLRAGALQHQHRFQADSLLIQQPQLSATLPGQNTDKSSKTATDYLKSLDLAHLNVQNGYVHIQDATTNPIIRGLEVAGTAIHFDSVNAPNARRIFFAKAWEVALGRSQATVAAHALALGSLHLSTSKGTFDLRSVRIRPPAAGQGQPGGVRIDLTLPSLALTGLDAQALQQKHFKAQSLVLDRPDLQFTPPVKPPPPFWKLLSKAVRRSDLAVVRVRHGDVRFGRWRHAPHLRDLNATGRGIRIDSAANAEPTRIAYARAWRLNTGRLSAPFDRPFYRASSQHVFLDTDAHLLRFSDMLLRPRFSPVGMNLHKGYQAPAVTIKVPRLMLAGLDFVGLVNRGDFRMKRATVQSPVVKIASDGRGPINPNRSKISPEEMLNLKVIVDVPRLDLVNGNLYSTYRSPLTPVTGTMNINRFNGSFFNLSNDRRHQTPARPLTGKATTYLQNQCRLDAQVSIYLLDPLGRHRIWGTFGPGAFAMLNSMTVPTKLVEFKSGQVQRIRFDMRVDRKGATGTMYTEYTGLQMKLLGYKDEEIKKTFLKNVISKAVNVVVIRDQNPRKRGKLVSGEMKSRREPRFSVFALWRQGVVSGLFNNVGVPQKIAQKLSEAQDEAPLPR
ncbi:hypothetical protein MON38_06505 [Hymenobacter sp. DH14]|uniref:Uncharacterized protein n=1 Tax=Hymenobacter cyanobacteriorum TaxID=2926463 RepID=A0A9X1VDC6_9BACT|nr:hypothetical protein [Hymenobacter cyanobacteriorum]MCI1187064.1 hypothetical protein [Hymenobacter cyanobacteriorum]